jgi:alkanesulfonate monooxygenase SsuD/methylene tetrahydromethanopterin reductase-like flavin-dependent oxidoreductase (luciferase family)
MKLGLLVEAEEGLDWEQWRATLHAAERLGFESVWISDHFASPWASERHGLDAWVALSVAAAVTRTVRLGTLVSPVTFREPALVARMAESIAALSGGRFVIGLGLGWNDAEHQAMGIAFPTAQERSQRLAQAVERIRRIHAASGVRVPLLIGGSGARRTLPLVARYADEWNVTTGSAGAYRSSVQELERLCAEIGRPFEAIRRSIACGLLVGRDADDLEARAARLRALVPQLASGGPESVATARQMGWVACTPADIVASLAELSAAGVDLAILGHYDLEDAAVLELVASEIMPRVT